MRAILITTRRRLAFLFAFGLATAAASACGGDSLTLPSGSDPDGIEILSGDDQVAAAGAALGGPLVVKVTDALDRPVEGQGVSFTVTSGGGQVTPAEATTDAAGQASAGWTLGPAAGVQRVQARVVGAGVPASLITEFSATAVSGTGSVLELADGDHQTGPVGSALGDSLVVRVTDGFDNPVSGVQVQWAPVGGGSLSPATVATDANGLAAAERVLGGIAGPQSATATVTGLMPVTFSHTAVAANPTALQLVSGDDQTGSAGSALPDSLVVRLVDDNGNGVGGKAITWLVSTGGGSVDPTDVTTDPNGLAATQWTLGTGTGSNVANAVYSGLPAVQFRATAGAGAASKLAFLQPPVNTGAGASITPAVKVVIQDASGNTVTSATNPVTLAIGTNPAGGTLSGTATVSAVNGVATFSNLSIDKVGDDYTLTAAAAGLTGATSDAFDILAGSANKLVFIVQPTDRIVGETFSPAIKVQVQDAGGNPVLLGGSGTITLTSSVPGTLTGDASEDPFLGTATFSNLALAKAGANYTLTAFTSGLFSATSASFDVAQASTTTTITGQSPNPSVAGQNFTVSYNVDPVAPGAGSFTGSVTVSDGTTSCTGGVTSTGTGSCVLNLPTVGSHQLTATYSGDDNFLTSASSSVAHTVNKASTTITIVADAPDPSVVGSAVSIEWTLESPGSATPDGTVQLTVSGGTETCSASAVLGTGSCELTFTVNGSRTITASYAGDANHNGDTDTETHGVRGETSTTLASDINPSTAGQKVTFTAHVAAVSGSGNPGGQVRFFDGATQIGQDNLNAGGDATLATTALAAGSHSITAAYQGSSTFAVSTSSVLTQQVEAANTAPTAADDGPYEVLEDGTLSVDGATGVLTNDSDPDGDPITAEVVSGPAHALSFTLNADGSFTYVPAADYNGSDGFTYHATDGSLSSNTAAVTITVAAVNDAPSFTVGPDQSVPLLAGAQTVSGWATAISAGPANESGQSVTFEVSTDDLTLFQAAPAISPDGTLTYTPDPLSLGGMATVTVRAQDDGGTSNGGVDTSTDATFTIAITS
jgi:hypothetical protein